MTLTKHLINLDEVSYAKENHDEDDYEPRYALHLNGPGKIGTTENNFEDLPSDKFEIPLEDDALYEYDGSRFLLTTSHAEFIRLNCWNIKWKESHKRKCLWLFYFVVRLKFKKEKGIFC